MVYVMKPPHLPPLGEVVVYATPWCPFCRQLLAALPALNVPFTMVDVDEDEQAAAFVEAVNGGNRVVPTVVFPDGSSLTNPEPDHVRARAAS